MTVKKTTTKKKPVTTTSSSADTPAKKPIAEVRADNVKLQQEVEKLTESGFCTMCGKHKPKSQFYKSSDPLIKSGITHICKKCAYNIACRVYETGEAQEPTKASVMMALEYIDKPFLNKLWDSSYFEVHNPTAVTVKSNIWFAYIKNVSMQQYDALRWKDGDIFKGNMQLGKLDAALPSVMEEEEYEKERIARLEVQQEYETNRKDVIKAIGYDPFDNYPNDADKPMLYGSLISFIDEDAKQDGMKMRAIIQIVQTFNQVEKINDTLNNYVNDAAELHNNIGSLDKLSGVINKLVSSANALAKDNGISVNHNNNKSKGANTLSGKIKMLNEIGFRDAKINTFDIETCAGMLQVAELSEKARHQQIGYDENIAQEIKDIKVELVETLQKERDAALESLRLLIVENMDLKNTLKNMGVEL